jgi:uncharacterized protein
MPRLASIRIYPVKGLAPVSLNEVQIDAGGALTHDRAWALQDDQGRFINGKNFPAIHTLRWLDTSDRDALTQQASTLLGRPLHLTERIPGGFPDDTGATGPTIVTQATFAEVAKWFPNMSEANARMRFRANLELSAPEPFWEDHLYPRPFRIGDVMFTGTNPCQRCIVPSRDALTGELTVDFQKHFMQMREQTLPPWAKRDFFNHHYRLTVNTRLAPDQAGKWLRLGDSVELL